MSFNFFAFIGAAVIPLLIGSIWYNPKVFGASWIQAIGKTEEELKGANMVLIFGLTFLFSFFLSFGLFGACVHQSGLVQLFAYHPDFTIEGTEINNLFMQVMNEFGEKHRSFGHGVIHGGLTAVLFALPLIGINALFERMGAKYIAIHFFYWFICMMLMGGIVCQFG